jgi:hypothetical protein
VLTYDWTKNGGQVSQLDKEECLTKGMADAVLERISKGLQEDKIRIQVSGGIVSETTQLLPFSTSSTGMWLSFA